MCGWRRRYGVAAHDPRPSVRSTIGVGTNSRRSLSQLGKFNNNITTAQVVALLDQKLFRVIERPSSDPKNFQLRCEGLWRAQADAPCAADSIHCHQHDPAMALSPAGFR